MNLKKGMLTSYISASELTEKDVIKLLVNYMGSSFKYDIWPGVSPHTEEENSKFKREDFELINRNGHIRTPTDGEIDKNIIEFCGKIGLNIEKYNGSIDFTADCKKGKYIIHATNDPGHNRILLTVNFTDRIKE